MMMLDEETLRALAEFPDRLARYAAAVSPARMR
jgi:hypothetical protein